MGADYQPKWPEEPAPPSSPEPDRRPRARRALARAVRHSYDHLGTVLLGSLLWALVGPGLALITVSALARSALGVALVPVAVAGLAAAHAMIFGAGARIATGRTEGAADLWPGLARFWPYLGVTATLLAALVLLAVNALFYSQQAGWVWTVVMVLLGYGMLLVLAVGWYALPAAAQQELGTRKALYRAVLLALDNPLFTLAMLVAQVASWLFALLPLLLRVPFISGLSVLWLLFGAAGSWAVLANEALVEVMRKYERE